jgi:hypothetical protein
MVLPRCATASRRLWSLPPSGSTIGSAKRFDQDTTPQKRSSGNGNGRKARTQGSRHKSKKPLTGAALPVLLGLQPLFVFRRKGQQSLNRDFVVDLFGEAAAPCDLLKQTGVLAIYLIRHSRHGRTLKTRG